MDITFNSHPSPAYQQVVEGDKYNLQKGIGKPQAQDQLTLAGTGYGQVQQQNRKSEGSSVITTGVDLLPKMQQQNAQQFQIRPMGQRFPAYIGPAFVGFTDAQKIALKYQIEILKMFKVAGLDAYSFLSSFHCYSFVVNFNLRQMITILHTRQHQFYACLQFQLVTC
eukprot:TRINITY_DN11984_c0_g2_i3.p2 TRINITY_DN11984_c0_g2~~TRINITY_DN11984_c0_g2_i3.p2  ORF type:complete len:167 (+),score=0.66 TRINITY_DN11984_c0_g2_i3:20-520(+)